MSDSLHYLDVIKHIEEGEEDEEEEEKTPYATNAQPFAQILKSYKKCDSFLIVDGSYFEIGIKDLERMNPNQRCLSVPQNIEKLLALIQQITGIKSFDWKSFHSAEEPKAKKRKAYYSVLENNGFIFDIREFKSKRIKCPNTVCKHNNKSFVTKVQAEVDVAITMTTMQLLSANPNCKNVVFIIGDRDFFDLFKHVRELNINAWVFGFRSNLSSHLFEVFSTEHIIYIDDYWSSFITSSMDQEFPPLNPSAVKVEDLRQINLKKCPSEATKLKQPQENKEMTSSKKRRNKKKKNKSKNISKKEEGKKATNYLKHEQSHSSTDDSLIDKMRQSKLPNGKQKSSLKDSELDIFIGLNISDSDVKNTYKKSGDDVSATLDAIIDSFTC